MKQKKAYLYVLDTLADWEPGYTISELNSGRMFKKGTSPYPVEILGAAKDSITSMGGIKMTPQLTVNEIDIETVGLLILPGADTWADAVHLPLFDLVKRLLSSGIPVAAICGATLALADQGILDNYKHTSNDLGFMQHTCPNYKGSNNYVHSPAVADKELITASGIAPLEFARAVFETLGVMEKRTLNAWYNLYATKEAKYFYELTESLSAE